MGHGASSPRHSPTNAQLRRAKSAADVTGESQETSDEAAAKRRLRKVQSDPGGAGAAPEDVRQSDDDAEDSHPEATTADAPAERAPRKDNDAPTGVHAAGNDDHNEPSAVTQPDANTSTDSNAVATHVSQQAQGTPPSKGPKKSDELSNADMEALAAAVGVPNADQTKDNVEHKRDQPRGRREPVSQVNVDQSAI